MSLARAFTKRVRRTAEEDQPTSAMGRSCTVKYTPGTIRRNMISLPTELISTTNVHALNAPDIRKVSSTSSSESLKSISGSENEFSTIDKGFLTADNSSIDSSGPATPSTPMDGSVKDFFAAKPTPVVAEPVPAIPKRAPSHSKKAHVELSRKRSIQRMSPPPNQISKPTTTRTSADFFSPSTTDPDHPFSRELAQVSEMAEEFSTTSSSVLDEEEQEMIAKGLCKFSANEYLDEIAPLWGGVFEDRLQNPWI